MVLGAIVLAVKGESWDSTDPLPWGHSLPIRVVSEINKKTQSEQSSGQDAQQDCGPQQSPKECLWSPCVPSAILLPLRAILLGEDAMKHPPGPPCGAVPSTGDIPVVTTAPHVCL